MTLGQSHPLLIFDQRAVVELRGVIAQRPVEQELAGGTEEQVQASDHLGDGHQGIVHHHRQLIAGTSLWSPNHKVAEVALTEERLRAFGQIGKSDGFRRDPETPGPHLFMQHSKPTGAPVEGFLVAEIWCPLRFLHLFARARTWVDVATGLESFEMLLVERDPLRLIVGTLIPIQPQPVEIVLGGLSEFPVAACTVQIFLTQHQAAPLLSAALMSDPESLGVAQMKQAGGSWGQASAVEHGRFLWLSSNHACMRWFLWLLLVSVAWSEVTPHRPIRCVRDRKAQLTAMETAITHFRHPLKGYTVDLIGVVHVGPQSYYEQLNREFKKYDAVLYELIADGSQGRPIPVVDSAGAADNPLSMVQHGMSSILGLDFQLDFVDYQPRNFVHADVSPEEFEKSISQRHESFAQILMRSMQSGETASPEAEKELSQVNMMAIFGRPAPSDRIHMRRFMALMFNQPEQMVELLEGPGGGTILSVRNQKALKVLGSEIKKGRKKLAIFYGAAHMLDMEKRLVHDYGVKFTGQSWVPAWDLKMQEKK